MGFAAMLIEGNDKLRQCDPGSIMNAVINVARTGITLNPVLKLAHLVPRGGKCVLDFDYKGLVKVLKDNGCIKHIDAIIVYEDETFSESNSPVVAPIHQVKYAKTEEDQKKRIYSGVYSRVLLPDNTVIYTSFMPYWEILKVEKVSPASSSQYSPWKTWRSEMVKKTKIKRDFKTLISGKPNEKVLAALEVEEQTNGIQFTDVEAIPINKEHERIELLIKDATTIDQLQGYLTNVPTELMELYDKRMAELTPATSVEPISVDDLNNISIGLSTCEKKKDVELMATSWGEYANHPTLKAMMEKRRAELKK
jgi:recombination protein RecT